MAQQQAWESRPFLGVMASSAAQPQNRSSWVAELTRPTMERTQRRAGLCFGELLQHRCRCELHGRNILPEHHPCMCLITAGRARVLSVAHKRSSSLSLQHYTHVGSTKMSTVSCLNLPATQAPNGLSSLWEDISKCCASNSQFFL